MSRTSPSSELAQSLRERFEANEFAVRAENYSRAGKLALVFMLAGSSLDWIVHPEHLVPFFLIRCLCAAALAVVVLLVIPRSTTRGAQRIASHLVAGLPTLCILWMIWFTKIGESTYYGGLNLVLVGASLLLRWPTVDSVINAGICFCGYLVVGLPNMTQESLLFNNAYFLFVTAVFASAGTYYSNVLRFNEFVLRDELEASQRALSENHTRLQVLDQAKTRFFANVSHELRTPLTLILGPLEQLRRSPSVMRDSRSVELITMLEDNGLRLLRLINDLLDLVRLDGDSMPLRPVKMELDVFVDSLANSLRPTAEAKQIAFLHRVEPSADNTGWIDRDRVEKILLNLAMNAIKFTPRSGTIELGAAVREGQVVFSVRDTGPGIMPSELPFVFERFWQADMTAKRKHGGVGIGLALVRTLTESMGGDITVQSQEGKGTTFHIALPWRATEALAQVIDAAPVVHEAPDIVEDLHARARLSGVIDADDLRSPDSDGEDLLTRTADQSRPTILIADDEPSLRRYLSVALSEYRVLEARDGKEALELAKQYQPQLAIIDYMMPEMDGIELARQLSQLLSTQRIPIVMVTANAENAPRLNALEAGVSDFLTKPFSTVELEVRVKNLLNQKRFERDLAVSLQELNQAHDELKDNEAKLLNAERLSGLGRMSAGIIHEVNNPLNYTSTALRCMRDFSKRLPEDQREDFDDILGDAVEGVDRVVRIISDLRSFTRGSPSAMGPLRLHSVVETARRLISDKLTDITLEQSIPTDLVIEGNESQLSQVFTNLVQNAASFVPAATKRGETPTIRITATRSETGFIEISVWDNGSGIRPEDLAKVFDPFFTKRDVGEGMGLGLSICHQILQTHRADVQVRSEFGRYTEFILCFPPSPSHTSPTPA